MHFSAANDVEATPNLAEVCINVEFGFLPHPNTCRSFVMCLFFNPIVIECAGNTPVFDGVSECVAGKKKDLKCFKN